MMKKLCVFALLSAVSASAFAQDGSSCTSPIPILSNSIYNSDTTSSPNSIGALGGLPSPGNDLIYSFTANGASGNVLVTGASYDFGIFLVPSCTGGSTGSPLQAATGPGATGSFPVDGLTDGQTYFIVVSGDPSVNAPLNGTLTFGTPTLPVNLQSFSID